MHKVVEVINFLHELDLLEAHLDEHQHFIDEIVVVESECTYSGMSKNLYFNENKERFQKYNVKHEILPAELLTPIPASYPEEDRKKWFDARRQNREAQQKYIFDKYKNRGDYICLSDCDEIWSRHYWNESIISCMEEGYVWIAPRLRYYAGFLDAPGSLRGHWRIARSDAPRHFRLKGYKRGYGKGWSGWHFSNCYKQPEDYWMKSVGIAQSCGILGWANVPNPESFAGSMQADQNPLNNQPLVRDKVSDLNNLTHLPEWIQNHLDLFPWLSPAVREGKPLWVENYE
jgi:beta-1,4-mannosyl-glycoprotein beta-1,4-N-acetylglucosaminyltransferase